MPRSRIIAICLFLSLVLGIGLIWPKCQELNQAKQKQEEKKFELRSQEEYFSNLNNISEELKKYQVPLSKIDSALPSDPSLPTLFDFLQKAAAQSGLVLKKIALASIDSSQLSEIKETQLILAVVGSYSSFKNFLFILEKSARLFEIKNISFSGETEVPLLFNLKITVYSY